MIGEGLGAIAGIAGSIINSGWQNLNYQLALENLRWQKEQGRKQFRLASAGRTDAFGNKQRYDDALNEWILNLSPMQKQIVTAGEREQLRSLTEDVERNRKIRQRQAKRGDDAAKDFTKFRAAYLYDTPKDEKRIRGEYQALLQGASEDAARDKMKLLSTHALRTGRGALLPTILGKGNDLVASDWSSNLLKARQMGLQESQARTQAHESKYLPLLRQLQETMDLGGDMPARFSDVPQRLAGEQGQQASLMLQALQNMATSANAASQNVTKAVSDGGVDLKGIASLIGAAGGGSRGMFGGGGSRRTPLWQQDVLTQNIGSF